MSDACAWILGGIFHRCYTFACFGIYWTCDLVSGMQSKVVTASQMLAFHHLTCELASCNQQCCDWSCHRIGRRCVLSAVALGCWVTGMWWCQSAGCLFIPAVLHSFADPWFSACSFSWVITGSTIMSASALFSFAKAGNFGYWPASFLYVTTFLFHLVAAVAAVVKSLKCTGDIGWVVTVYLSTPQYLTVRTIKKQINR